MHVLGREWSLEENDDEGMLQEVGVFGYKKDLKQS